MRAPGAEKGAVQGSRSCNASLSSTTEPATAASKCWQTTSSRATLQHLTQSLLTAAQRVQQVSQGAVGAAAAVEQCQALQRDNTLLRNAMARLQQNSAEDALPCMQPTPAAGLDRGKLHQAQETVSQLTAAVRAAERDTQASKDEAAAARRSAAAAEAALAEARAAQEQLRCRVKAAEDVGRANASVQVGEELWRGQLDVAVASAVAAEELRWTGRVASARAAAAEEAAAAVELRGKVERMRGECANAGRRVVAMERAAAEAGAKQREAEARVEGLLRECRRRVVKLGEVQASEAGLQAQVQELREERERGVQRRGRELEERAEAAEARAAELEGRVERAKRDAEEEVHAFEEEARRARSALVECERREDGLQASVAEERTAARGHAARAAALEEQLVGPPAR